MRWGGWPPSTSGPGVGLALDCGAWPAGLPGSGACRVGSLQRRSGGRAIEAGNVERGHVPRSMFLVTEWERSGSGNNLV